MAHMTMNYPVLLSEKTQTKWREMLKTTDILYLYAMCGFGKTAQAEKFAEKEYKDWRRVSLQDGRLDALQACLAEIKDKRTRFLLILDDLQWVTNPNTQAELARLLTKDAYTRPGLRWMLLSCAALPPYLTQLRLTGQLEVDSYESLTMQVEQLTELIGQSGLAAARPDLDLDNQLENSRAVHEILACTQGYPLGIIAMLQRLQQPGVPLETAWKQGSQDVYLIANQRVYGRWNTEQRSAMVKLSVCGQFTLALARELLGPGAQEILGQMMTLGSFITENAPGQYNIHPFFREFLRKRLQELPEREWREMYTVAGAWYEKNRYLQEALECYDMAGSYHHMVEILCYLGENAEGCGFARLCQRYMDRMPPEYFERYPRLLGVQAMLYSYRLMPERSNEVLERLRVLTERQSREQNSANALESYIRTRVALPHLTAADTLRDLPYYAEYLAKEGTRLQHVMPTGNMPSMLNGGRDLLPWCKNARFVYPLLKKSAAAVLGSDAAGIAETAMAEYLYEKGQSNKAVGYLTNGMSDADLAHNFRAQYCATAVMARLLTSDNQLSTAWRILSNMKSRAESDNYYEMVPNIRAGLVQLALYKGTGKTIEEWLYREAADEFQEFYITDRYQLMVKARCYLVQKRTIEALHILGLLHRYAVLYERTYFRIEVQLLQAILAFRNEEPWEELLLETAQLAASYSLMRVLSDQGAALLPLWKQLDKSALPEKYAAGVSRQMQRMSTLYPLYLSVAQVRGTLSKKELEVLRVMADGKNNNEIAQTLHLSLATVKFHISNILKKLGAENRVRALHIAREEKLL